MVAFPGANTISMRIDKRIVVFSGEAICVFVRRLARHRRRVILTLQCDGSRSSMFVNAYKTLSFRQEDLLAETMPSLPVCGPWYFLPAIFLPASAASTYHVRPDIRRPVAAAVPGGTIWMRLVSTAGEQTRYRAILPSAGPEPRARPLKLRLGSFPCEIKSRSVSEGHRQTARAVTPRHRPPGPGCEPPGVSIGGR